MHAAITLGVAMNRLKDLNYVIYTRK